MLTWFCFDSSFISVLVKISCKQRVHFCLGGVSNPMCNSSPAVSLAQRCSWLSRAVVLLRGGAGASPGTGRLLRELEDRAEVARLQRRLLQHAQHRLPPYALQQLNTTLLDITKVTYQIATGTKINYP